jgi:hypothetical protein
MGVGKIKYETEGVEKGEGGREGEGEGMGTRMRGQLLSGDIAATNNAHISRHLSPLLSFLSE